MSAANRTDAIRSCQLRLQCHGFGRRALDGFSGSPVTAHARQLKAGPAQVDLPFREHRP